MIQRAVQIAACFAGAALALARIGIAQPAVDPAVEQPAFPVPPSAHLHDGLMMRLGWGPAHLYSRGYAATAPVTFTGSPSPRLQPPGRGMTDLGIAANLDVGGAISRGIVFGVDLTSHMFVDPEVEGQPSNAGGQRGFDPVSCCSQGLSLLSVGGFVLVYPDPRGGFSSGITLSSMTAYEFHEGPSGWAVAPQLGYDGWVGEQWSLGAFLRVTFARLAGEGGGFGSDEATYNAALTTLGIALTYQ